MPLNVLTGVARKHLPHQIVWVSDIMTHQIPRLFDGPMFIYDSMHLECVAEKIMRKFCTFLSDCGRSIISTTDRVTHGTETLAGEWPWTVAISKAENGETPKIICGGALLDTRTVLTAAHCLTDAENFILFFGKYNRSVQDDDQEVKVGRSYQLILHPDFNEDVYDNDIAIVKFQPDVIYSERIQPICLPTRNSTARNVVPGKKGYVSGLAISVCIY
ncbi:Suppressor of tumorigenicity 14 [Araneus ventricosus]|uniref:Suppressor of tumorigenicity 14 n=1 Tax=Araneus ventricosus TaxID=182803 RepID=A0A4Y2JHQ7_ARAVE|nr:Suppressor of tumorigenicity 14 [Araneus ventricosus]